MSTQLVRLAAAVLTSEKGRRTVGWVLTAILSPVILLVAFLCCVGSGTTALSYRRHFMERNCPQVSRQNTGHSSRRCGDPSPIWIRRWPRSIRKPRETVLTRCRSRLFSLPSALERMHCHRQMQRRSWLASMKRRQGCGRRRMRPMRWPCRFLWRKSMRSYPCGGAVRSRQRNAPMP